MLAERARVAIAELTVEAGGRLVGTTVSVGVAETGPGTRTADDLFAAADSALYAAKHGGRNRVAAAPRTWTAAAPVHAPRSARAVPLWQGISRGNPMEDRRRPP